MFGRDLRVEFLARGFLIPAVRAVFLTAVFGAELRTVPRGGFAAVQDDIELGS